MTCEPTLWFVIPETTAQAAQRAFPKGNVYMTMRDIIGPIVTNPDFVDLYHARGRPAEAPARLALVLVMLESAHLSDAQAAEAVRARSDWTQALALDLEDPGVAASILTDVRARLLAHGAEERLLTLLLDRLVDAGLLKGRGRQRRDSTHVLANIRTLRRRTLVAETMRHARTDLADAAPDWLRSELAPHGGARYAVRVEAQRLPKDQTARQALVPAIGQDGFALLTARSAPTTPPDLQLRRAIQTVRAVWLQHQYGPHDLRWRVEADLPPHAPLISAPYAGAARCATKRATAWTGDTVHLRETCDDATPHLITHGETTPATTNDSCMTATIHTHLAAHALLPRAQLLDSGYMAADLLVRRHQDQHVDLVGPVLADTSWQARQADGLDGACCAIDWDQQSVPCPAGKHSVRWKAGHDKPGDGPAIIAIPCAADDCRTCPLRARCTQAKDGPRTMQRRPRDQHAALQTARKRQTTAAFNQRYARRAGIAGTLSQGVRACGLRQANYSGQTKTHLQHILIAIASTIVRVVAWIEQRTRTTTRLSPLARLVATMP